MSNPYEDKARLAKAYALSNVAEALVRQIKLASDEPDELRGPDEAADALEVLIDSEQHWEELARQAYVKVPSRDTRLLVVKILRDRASAVYATTVAVDAAVTSGKLPKRTHPLPFGPCDWACGSTATITLRCADGMWYRCCSACYGRLGVHADTCGARTIQGSVAS